MDHGGFILVDVYTKTIVAEELNSPLAMSLDQVEAERLSRETSAGAAGARQEPTGGPGERI